MTTEDRLEAAHTGKQEAGRLSYPDIDFSYGFRIQGKTPDLYILHVFITYCIKVAINIMMVS